jgi:rsbT co-antagonist protein RsbR
LSPLPAGKTLVYLLEEKPKETALAANTKSRIAELVRKNEKDLLSDWLREQMASTTRRADLINESELRDQSREFLSLFADAAESDGTADIKSAPWMPVRDLLSGISESRAQKGFSPSEIAMFIFSFKQPLFSRLRKELAQDPLSLADENWTATILLDKLGLFTTEVFQKAREGVIARQQEEMMELSTPVVKLWDGILALPMIGTLDSSRTQVVMESLLNRIVETGADTAILDITGVPTVDTLVAQHLIKTVTAARLMGADCIISGIRPQIAQTIVHLGVDLKDVITKANLADAFAIALKRRGLRVVRADASRNGG